MDGICSSKDKRKEAGAYYIIPLIVLILSWDAIICNGYPSLCIHLLIHSLSCHISAHFKIERFSSETIQTEQSDR